MIKGDNVLIHDVIKNEKVLATFYESIDGKYIFKNISGVFGISEDAEKLGVVKLEIIEDY